MTGTQACELASLAGEYGLASDIHGRMAAMHGGYSPQAGDAYERVRQTRKALTDALVALVEVQV